MDPFQKTVRNERRIIIKFIGGMLDFYCRGSGEVTLSAKFRAEKLVEQLIERNSVVQFFCSIL